MPPQWLSDKEDPEEEEQPQQHREEAAVEQAGSSRRSFQKAVPPIDGNFAQDNSQVRGRPNLCMECTRCP